MAGISFSGLASGIDGDAIIKTLIDGRKMQSAPLEKKLANNETENKALEEFNTKLLTLNDTLKDFLTLSGGAVSKTAASSNEDAVTATAGTSAVASTTTFTVNKLAKSATISLADTFTDLSSPIAPGLSSDGALTITVGSGANAETLSIPVSSTTTVDGLVTAINNASSTGRVRATVVNVGTEAAPQYRLVVSSTKTGTDHGYLEITPSAELAGQGVLGIGNITQAQNAEIQLDSIGVITRSTNQISDLIPGVTLDLKQENTGPVVVSVGNDSDKSAKKVLDMVTAYNEVVKHSRTNSKIERVQGEKGMTNSYGSLARTNTDNRAVDSLRRAIDQTNSDIDGGKVRILADLGITTERDGTLKFDQDVFMKAVADDSQGADRVLHDFADRVGSTNGVIHEYTKFQGVLDSSISSNDDEIQRLNDKLARIDELLERQQQQLKLTFAKLEQNVARLNSNSDALMSLYNNARR